MSFGRFFLPPTVPPPTAVAPSRIEQLLATVLAEAGVGRATGVLVQVQALEVDAALDLGVQELSRRDDAVPRQSGAAMSTFWRAPAPAAGMYGGLVFGVKMPVWLRTVYSV
ncbi:hypothetical protein G6F59_015995 [Rhizopus arrhizus]|nr:hypothetical protein G6F59_015995 [Rhizopus arrhizus]